METKNRTPQRLIVICLDLKIPEHAIFANQMFFPQSLDNRYGYFTIEIVCAVFYKYIYIYTKCVKQQLQYLRLYVC